jgi:hypothetical protein
VAHERQQPANLKVEFPGVDAAGIWEIQLVDAQGQALGPVARFTLAANDPNQEMYVHYVR